MITARQFINALLVGLLLWTVIGYVVLGDSRQRCTASPDTCAWELR